MINMKSENEAWSLIIRISQNATPTSNLIVPRELFFNRFSTQRILVAVQVGQQDLFADMLVRKCTLLKWRDTMNLKRFSAAHDVKQLVHKLPGERIIVQKFVLKDPKCSVSE